MGEKFASELLQEIKANAKRWFIAFIVMVAVEIVTIFGFVWYISLPVEEAVTTEQSIDDIDASHITQIGGNYNGNSKADENNLQAQSNPQ